MAQNNNFWVDMIANLKKSQSKKQVQTDAKKLGDIFVSLIGTLNKVKTKAQLKKDLQSINPTIDLTTKINKKSVNTSVQQTVKQAQATAKRNPVKIDVMLDLKKSKLLSDIRYFGQQNSKLFKDAGLTSRYNSLLDNAKLASSGKEIRNLRLQLSAMRSELKATNMSGLSLGDTLKKTFKRAVELFSGTGFVMLISQQLREAWTEALNLDKSYTDLIKVQDRLTRGDYPEYLEQCNKKAKDLATTQKALIEGVTEFSKSGYDLTTSNKLSEQSTVLSNVGEMDASSSAKAIISGVQAFEQVQGYTDVIDKAKILIDIYNEIGNTSAITTKEIAEGVQAVGSVFADANTSVEEFVSLLSAGNRQYQDADEMALALRTAALRLRGAKVELEAMGEETEGMITSVSKLEEKIKALTDIDGVGGMEGVSLLEADGETFRSIYDIFLDISKVYQDMADVDQSALLELVSGKHRASAISATLKNMAEAQEIYKRSLEASGSAQEEYSKYLESSEASLNRFKASMTETYQSVINGETVKGILDTGNATLEFANSIGLVESSLKGLIAIGVVKAMTALSTAFKASAISASNFGTALNTVKSMSAMTQGTTEYANALKSLKMVSSGLTEVHLKQVLANKSLDNSTRISILRATGLTKAQSQARLSQMGLTQSTKAQTVAQNSAIASTFSLTSAIKGFSVSLKAAFMSNPVGISIMALSTIIGAVSSKVSDYNEEIRETRQANIDVANSAMEEANELNDLFIQYKNLSGITDKTSQQEEDFKQVIEDITEALGDKAEILEGLTEGTDKYAESLEKATKAELEGQYATAKVGAKAASDALEEKTYSSWDGSKISILKNEQMTGIKEHVAALEVVEDILAKYEDMSSYGVEWEPIGWDDNRHDMNAVVEYYNDLIEARTKLVTADNADFLMSSDIYEDINTTINNLSASVEEYTKQQYNALKLNYEWQNGIPSTKAEFEAMEKSILEASGAGEEFQEILKDYLAQDFSTLIALPDTEIDVDTGGAEQELTKLFDKLTTSKDALSKFVSSVQSASEAYSNLMNPNVSSADILSSIQSINEAVSSMGGSLNWEFIDKQENSLEILGGAIDHISRKYAESVLSGAGIDVNSKFGQMLANNIIQAQKASEQLSNLNTNIDSLQSAYSDLTDIVEAYNETGYLTFDQLQTLLELEPQYLQCLIDENGQLQLNEQAMVALANQRLNDAEAQAVQQAITELGQLALHDEKTAVEENAQAFTDAVDDLADYNKELANTIAEATVGATCIRDLNAAIQGAESEGATDDQINTVLSNLETKLQAINSVRDKLNVGGLDSVINSSNTSSASKSGKDAGDAYLDAFKKELAELQYALDKDIIREVDYYTELEKLNKKYFEGREEYLDEYRKHEVDVYKYMKEHNSEVTDQLQSELDGLQSGYDGVKDAVSTYNKYGKITLDQGQELLDTDFRLLAIMNEEENAYYSLANAKLEEMKIQLARNAIDAVNGLQTEAQAVEYLAAANINLRNTSLSATEAMLQQAVALKQAQGGSMADAATTIYQGYQNAINMVGKVDLGFSIPEEKTKNSSSSDTEKTEKAFHETLDWIEKFLENLSKKTEKLLDKVDKFLSWQKKNSMINRAVKSTDNEISQNQKAHQAYMNRANAVGLSKSYIQKIQNGSLRVEDIFDESLNDKISEYMKWYDKAQDCLDTVEELYEQERDLIRQKLDNVIDYYSDMDSYLSSVTSKVESLISLNGTMGKRSSLTELLQQYSDLSAQLSSVTQSVKKVTSSVTEINFGDSESVEKAINANKQSQIDALQSEIDNLAVDQSGTYTKLLQNIAKTEAQIDKYFEKGWDETKTKQYEKLVAKLDDYYDLQAELDTYATSNTIANYNKIYTAYQKLQNKIDDGGTLTKSQQKKYDTYLAQLDALRDEKDSVLSELETELGLIQGTIKDSSAEQKARQKIADVQNNLEETATYKNLLNSIEATEDKISVLDEKGYDNLTKAQKKTYDKLVSTLEDYYAQKEALDENATASTVAEYNKIYLAWRTLQDKLDAGGNLSDAQWKTYNNYTKQLDAFKTAKEEMMAELEEALSDIVNPKGKLDVIDAEYEKSAEGIYDSYQTQIEGIKNAVTETAKYKSLLAKAQKLEQKKDTKGLNTSEQANLDKYNAELDALIKGGTTSNISNYMSTWEKWYALQKKLDKNGKLSASDAKNYDTYSAQLEAWNQEKQTQINDLTSLMEDELEALQKTYVENVSEAESEVSEYYANLYDLAKQVAEYNLNTLESQLAFLDAYISYYEQLVTLYDQFSGDKLANLLSDLDVGLAESQESLYTQYLDTLNQKYDATLSKINEFNELIDALDTNDFENSMSVFQDAIAKYKSSGQTAMANKLQSVLDLLNERAVEGDNWDEYADEWLNEWESSLAEAKNELIGIAGSIQEVNDALREIKFSNITDAITELNNFQDILSSITGLINDDWVHDEDGNLTSYGTAKVGLLMEQVSSAKQEVAKYAEMIKQVEAMQHTYSSEDAYKEALQNAKMDYLSSLSDLQSYQDSVVAILTKADDSVINSLNDVIAKRKEALQKKKELYDYGKTIESSQKEIDTIKAQVQALESLSGSMDAATKAKLAQLKADLADKEDALQDTKDEHTYNLQIDALDEFLNTLSDTMGNVTDSVNASFETYVEAINAATKIYSENKDYLNEWSNSIIDTTLGLGETIAGNSEIVLTSNHATNSDLSGVSLDTSHIIGGTENVYNLIKDGVLVKSADTLLVDNPNLMNYLNTYIPPIAVNINHNLPQIANRNNQPVINNHYDCLLKVEGNVDKAVAQLLPTQLEEAYKYTTKKLYRELNALK